MAIFKIKYVEKHWVEVYEVEAETKEEAINKYAEDLAGILEPIASYYNEHEHDDDIFVID